ncbi:putative Ig domain-containing protein [Mucilaginibacter sp.]|uniref:putative Ig domain-containing protein n=1 Tax=Mucilaginibacter sp. TaxID=1882438 RepID=UPI0026343A9B|nr:putative Ig domain-containing protein [Mucilaginibacter sp.]MDB5032561.1 pknD 4 [Mucilaginibacter sp.]
MNKPKHIIFLLFLLLSTSKLFAQAPVITYNTPQILAVGSAVSLSPTNTGGAVPATVYGTVSTFAGTTSGFVNGTGTTNVKFALPRGMTIDASGNMYIADQSNNAIRKITAAGVVTTLAGSGVAGKINATGTSASFNTPYDVTVDGSGNVYVADYANNEIRKITSAGVVSLLTGSVTGATGFTNGTGSAALFNGPAGIAYSSTATAMYVSDYTNNEIRKVTSAGVVTLLAGSTTGVTGNTNGTTTAARFNGPTGIAVDAAGNIYVADQNNNQIRKITSAGVVTLFAGNTAGTAGSADGTGSAASFNNPRGVAVDASGNVYINDSGNFTIRMITPTGVVTTIAGNGTAGLIDAVGTAAEFDGRVLKVDPTTGNIFLADYNNNVIRKIIATGYSISPTLPAGLTFDSTTGIISGTPTAIATSTAYTIKAFNSTGSSSATITLSVVTVPSISYSPAIQTYSLNHAISTYSPTSSGGAIASFTGYGIGTQVTGVTLSSPFGIAKDASGNIYVANSAANNIIKYSTGGTISAFITGVINPVGLVFDSSGNCYVLSNAAASKVYKYPSTGGSTGTLLTFGATALQTSFGIAIDAADNLYITNYSGTTTNTYKVYKCSTSGGSPLLTIASTTNLSQPVNVALDNAGNIYILNIRNNTVVKYNSAGTFQSSLITTTGAPYGLCVDGAGHIYVGDPGAGTVKVYNPAGGTALFSITQAGSRGLITDNAGMLYVSDFTNSKLYKYVPNGGYFISPNLPIGLSISSTTGNITGTPTAVTAMTTYTVTAYNTSNAGGSSTTQINISIQLLAPDISYTTPVSYFVSAVITSPTLTNAGSPVVTTVGYSSTAAQPFGTTFNNPSRMAVDASGNIYIANFSGNNIVKYASDGTTLITTSYGTGAPALVNPMGIVFDSAGNCYVLNANATIYKYNSTGAYQSTITVTGAGTTYGLAIDASDRLYITSYGTSTAIYRYTTAGVGASIITASLSTPVDVDIDAAGNIFVLNQGNNTVEKYTTAFVASSFKTGLSTPFSLKIDKVNSLMYIGNTSSNNILVCTPATSTTLYTISNATDCRGLALDLTGTVYSANFTGNQVYQFSPSGGYFLNKTLPAGLTFTATSGAIAGTPSVSSAATDYTVTAWNAAGSGSGIINITCYQKKTWIGTGANISWITAGNWTGGVPGPADQIIIGATGTLSTPTISAAGVTQIGSIVMQNGATTAPSISVSSGATLTVTGDITYQNLSATVQVATLSGAGTINAANLNVVNNFSAPSYPETLASSVANLSLSGNLSLTSTHPSGTRYDDAAFNLTSGIMTVSGIQTSNAIVNNSPNISIGNNTTLQFTGATPLSGLSSTGTNTITIGTGVTIGYTGTNDQVVYSNMAVPNSNLTTGISYANILFSGSGVKTVQGDNTKNLNISGSFTNSLTSNGTTTFVDLSGPTVNFTGSGQSLAGGSGTGTTLFNTVFTGGAKTMSGKFNEDNQSAITFNGTSSTTLDAGAGSLTLNSDAAGSATIASLNPAGTVTGVINGTVNVQRFVTGGGDLTNRGYRLFSSPVSDVTATGFYNLSYFFGSGTYITGAGGVAGGFDVSGNPTIYLYREDKVPSVASFNAGNYRAITKINNNPNYNISTIDGDFNLPVGNGILFFFRGNNSTNASIAPNDVILTTLGHLNQGQVVVKDWFNSGSNTLANSTLSGSTSIQGFNLVGNPYASSIDWNTIYNNTTTTTGICCSTNLSNSIYIYNTATKNYSVYTATSSSAGFATGAPGASNIIPQGQGFFVRALTSSAQLIFNESAKVTNQPAVLLLNAATPVADQHLRLQLTKDAINKDEAVIVFNNAATTAYSQRDDALYLKGSGLVSLSAMSSNKLALALYQTPLPKQSQTIPLNISVTATGTYQLNLTEAKNIPAIYDVWLMDAYKKDSLDIKHNPNYSFMVTADTSTTGSHRFSLVIRQNLANAVHLLSFNATKGTTDVKINWSAENEGNYTTFVLERSINNGSTFTVLDSLTSAGLGTYNDLDPHPVTGQNLYRLKMVDINGNITYSTNVVITFTQPNAPVVSNINVYPNPTKSVINLAIKQGDSASAPYKISISNNTGIVVKTGTSGQPEWHTDVSTLLPGTYFIEVVNTKTNSLTGRSAFIKL